MTTTRRRGGSAGGDPGGPLGGGSTFRGALLIAVAVIVGVVLLGKGFESGVLSSDANTPSEDAAAGDNGDGEGTTTSATVTPTTHPTAQVRVIVLNGGGPAGSAGTARTTLSAAGYTTLDATDTEPDVSASVVYYTAGFEADAAAIATAIGVTAAPQPLPEPPPQNTPVGQVDIVVVLGPDFIPPG